MATSNDYHLKRYVIEHHKVPYTLFSEKGGDQFLFKVDEKIELKSTVDVTKKVHNKIHENFIKDIKYIENKTK